ncbi:predicted protein [Histoplasma mississippiense (nom. inval.)]|uniref:predicted protein n=1 Tax=Ajellomyces capsulatus (strain NAm1 / WU24) TaxID=2059318 RepID=UPI000157CFF5|nr:predicted protein [Histoplasma mississippiense (nom. inval.)]EDN11429.1 predicted protein [Histoplasma mississippiense (nom. inval.)]
MGASCEAGGGEPEVVLLLLGIQYNDQFGPAYSESTNMELLPPLQAAPYLTILSLSCKTREISESF